MLAFAFVKPMLRRPPNPIGGVRFVPGSLVNKFALPNVLDVFPKMPSRFERECVWTLVPSLRV
jgi:hypothetical protein